MTFSEFQSSGQDVDDIGAAIDAPDLAGRPGRVYAGGLHIERAPGGWAATIGNGRAYSTDLADVEERLWHFARGEGIA